MNTQTWHIHTSWAVGAVAALLVFVFAFHYWLVEHDARLKAEEQERISEVIIKQNAEVREQLKQQIADVEADRDKQVAAIRKQQAAIKTATQAVPAIVDIAGLPASSFRQLPTGNYEVDAPATVTIAQKLEDGRVCKIQLDACSAVLDKERQTNALLTSDNVELNKEKQAWKQASGRKSFLGKVWQGTKNVAAIGGVVGLIIAVAH